LLDVIGRPRKATQASRANGALAKNKGKPVDVKEELFGGFDKDDSYVIRTVKVRRQMAKGEIRRHELGCEANVFTYCLYHGNFVHFEDGDQRDGQRKRVWESGVDADRWEAAAKRARQMLEQCADASPRAKIAKLRKLVKGAKVRIKFGR